MTTTTRPRRVRLVLAMALVLGFFAVTASASGIARPAFQTTPAAASETVRPAKPVVSYGQDAQHSAFPSATRLTSGALLVVYRQGSNHYTARDGFIRSTTSTDLGKTWSASATVIPAVSGTDYRDPSISTSNDGSTLYLTYFKGTTAVSAAGSFFRSSTDAGATWSPEVRIDPNLPSSAITAPAVQLADGSLEAVHYSKAAGDTLDSVWSSRSTDAGATWTATRLVNGQTAGRDYQEPYLVRRGASLFLTFRWGNNASIGSSLSTDSGATWTTPAADFPGSGRPSSVWLSDGTIVVYVRDSAGRYDIRVTHDNGSTWYPQYMIQSPPKGGMSTYASLVETSPGQIFTVMSSEDSTATTSTLAFNYLGEGSQQTPFGFVPGDVLSSRLNYDALTYASSFQQPNGALPAPWNVVGGLTVTDGLLRSAVADNVADYGVIDTGSTDQRVEADFSWTGQAGFGVVLRFTDANNWLLFTVETGGANLRLYKNVAGAVSQLALVTGKPVGQGSFNTLSAAIHGTTVTAGVNGETLIHYDLTAGDNATLNGTYSGVKVNEQSGSTTQCKRVVVSAV